MLVNDTIWSLITYLYGCWVTSVTGAFGCQLNLTTNISKQKNWQLLKHAGGRFWRRVTQFNRNILCKREMCEQELSVHHLLTTSHRGNIQYLHILAKGGSTEHYNMQIPIKSQTLLFKRQFLISIHVLVSHIAAKSVKIALLTFRIWYVLYNEPWKFLESFISEVALFIFIPFLRAGSQQEVSQPTQRKSLLREGERRLYSEGKKIWIPNKAG